MIQTVDGITGDQEHEMLVAQVKELQRTNPDAKDQWVAYTDMAGQGTRDPNKHTCEFLTGFLVQLNSGNKLPVHEDSQGIAEAVKLMQRKSSNFKSVWHHYCERYGMGRNDPAKHDNVYHVRFLDFMAHTAWVSLQNSGQLPPVGGEPPVKRMRNTGSLTPSSGDPTKDQLVAMVKNFQRLGEAQKELWARYCDMYLGGIRDPGRHDVHTLHEFCNNHGVPAVSADDDGMGCGRNAGLGNVSGGMCMDYSTVGGVNLGGDGVNGGPVGGSFGTATDMGMGMLMDAGGMPSVGSMGVAPAVGSGDSYKDMLVVQVKQFQRQGDQQKELWGMYADMYLGGIRDPNRHDVNTLQEFCANHNVSPVSGDPVAASISRGGQTGMGIPGPALPPDPLKDPLVQRIKNYQKGPPEQKEAWNTFSGATRDPARHEASKLQEFIALYNVP